MLPLRDWCTYYGISKVLSFVTLATWSINTPQMVRGTMTMCCVLASLCLSVCADLVLLPYACM